MEIDMLATRCSEFDRLLQSAIDDALVSLGESVRQAIYFHIENKFNVPRNHVPENLGEFQQGLEKIFGAGARFIEILIMKNLYSKIGLPLEINNLQLEFIAYVNAARKAACQNNQQNQECPSMLITEEAHSGFIVALSKPDEVYSASHPSVLHSIEKLKKSQQGSEARLGGEE